MLVKTVVQYCTKPTLCLVFQFPGLDYKHCLLEYNEQDNCYIVQDLNTAQGTYVNDVRVQNAAVRLAHGDVIRFGVNSPPYEFYMEDAGSVSFCLDHMHVKIEKNRHVNVFMPYHVPYC